MAVTWIDEANWPEAWSNIWFSPIVKSGDSYSLYVGGWNVAKFYSYNISTDTWAELAVPPAAINGAISMSPDGTKLAAHIGGNILFIYDIGGNSWSSSGAAPNFAINGGATATIQSTVWADNDTIWVQVRGYISGSQRVKCYRYVVSTDTWTQFTNYITPTRHAGVCMTINTAGDALFVGNIGDNVYAGMKYVIATDTYSSFTIGSSYRFYGSSDRTAKLWHWHNDLGIKYWDCDTETASAIIFADDPDRNKTTNLACGVYGEIYIIAWHITSEPKNRSYFIGLTTTAPSVTTQAASGITINTATGNGNVTNLGVPVATQHGHVWAIHTLPTTDDNKKENGAPSTTGAYTSSIIDLIPNTFYYCSAFITNSVGTFYGEEVTFTTVTAPPVISDDLELATNLATEVAATTALGNGRILNNGGSPITQHGHVWSTSANPTTGDSKTELGAMTVVGRFSSLMTGLNPGTLYHFRSYAVNSTGTGYGPDVTFTTLVAGAPIVVTRDTINVSTTTATGVGNIIDLGGDTVTQHGHVWGTSLNPTTGGSKTTLDTGTVGAFASDITGLVDGNTYYIRAYATNSYGTAYGNNDVIFPTSVWGATRGHLAVVGEHLAYTSRSGKKRAEIFPEF